jgi:ferredoxin
MPKLLIDNQEVEVPAGSTILDAARKLGINIPTLCFREDCSPSTSCMACLVKLQPNGKLVPSCAYKAEEGMRVESESTDVRGMRRAAIEFLLSDHFGDCMGPCHTTCPAHMNIPLMIRQIAEGDMEGAIRTVKADIALPAILGRICPKPCEGACRRGTADTPVAICLLKQYAGDVDLATGDPYLPPCQPSTGKKIAIVGTGPAGLAAAFHLQQAGCSCTFFDANELPGGPLRYQIAAERLPRSVLDGEINVISRLGAHFQMRTRLGADVTIEALKQKFDAVLIVIGETKPAEATALGLKASAHGIQIDKATWETSIKGVFAAGDAVRRSRVSIRSVAEGKAAAHAIAQFVAGVPIQPEQKPFNSRLGFIEKDEALQFLAHANHVSRITPHNGSTRGFDQAEAVAEALRCLHCDCRKADDCRLRHYAEATDASQTRYKGERRVVRINHEHASVVYEPGKCIRCGVCIQVAQKFAEPLGLSFIGRGFDVQVAVPFNETLGAGLRQAANACAEACPTGALSKFCQSSGCSGCKLNREPEVLAPGRGAAS